MNNAPQAAVAKPTASEARTSVAQKLWQLQVFLDAAGLPDQSELAYAAIKQLATPQSTVEPWYYHAECADPDYSCLCNNMADAQTAVNEHGGFVQSLWNTPPDLHTAPLLAKITELQRQVEGDRLRSRALTESIQGVATARKGLLGSSSGGGSLFAEIENLQKTIANLSSVNAAALAMIARAKELKARNDELQSALDRCADAAWLLYDGNFYDQQAVKTMSPSEIIRNASAYAGYKPVIPWEKSAVAPTAVTINVSLSAGAYNARAMGLGVNASSTQSAAMAAAAVCRKLGIDPALLVDSTVGDSSSSVFVHPGQLGGAV